MIPITWPELAGLHPYVPVDQAQGYAEMFRDLAAQVGVLTFGGGWLRPWVCVLTLTWGQGGVIWGGLAWGAS
jgi:hypothetical protein